MLRSLHMKDVGPAARLDLELGERLNVLTGDNGLGKSFVLDVAWWALTGAWVGRPVLPERGKEDQAVIGFQIDGLAGQGGGPHTAGFRRVRQDWEDPVRRPGNYVGSADGLWRPAWLQKGAWAPVIYARANGSFSVWDPARHRPAQSSAEAELASPQPYHLDAHELWYGLELDGKLVCNGLIQDWTRWLLEAAGGSSSPYDLLRDVLRRLSHPGELMEPGKSRRLYLDDVRDYPTIDLPYGNVPVVHLSAGMRRVVSLSYLIVWAWTEHEQACQLLGWKPAERMVFLLDEVESHLHPEWQRHILPSLVEVLAGLGVGIKPQVLVTTHSPMVMASIEPHFDQARDKLFLFELLRDEVSLREVPWTKHGDAVGWLTSPIFGLEQARSPEAERAIAAAYDYVAGRRDKLPAGLTTEDEIDRELRRVLPDQDKFWPRWVVRRERTGGA
jgi:AAA domain, putative AbiEii toxin, Type IV TA system